MDTGRHDDCQFRSDVMRWQWQCNRRSEKHLAPAAVVIHSTQRSLRFEMTLRPPTSRNTSMASLRMWKKVNSTSTTTLSCKTYLTWVRWICYNVYWSTLAFSVQMHRFFRKKLPMKDFFGNNTSKEGLYHLYPKKVLNRHFFRPSRQKLWFLYGFSSLFL